MKANTSFMKKLSWLFVVITSAVLFFQCQKELHFIGGPDNGAPVTPDPITASLQGNITDENDQPAANVVVTAGASTAITDANGYFRFTDASLDKNTSLVTASKDGYFKGYRVFAATSGCNQVVIKLIKKNIAGTVAASTGGKVTLPNGAEINLPANGVVTASSNSAYNGDIKVYAFYINPSSSDIGRAIPGSLAGNSKEGKRVVLSSYGMLAVELSSAGGEKLQIKSGSSATLTIPIPSSSLASAPATIPLWYVDETTGIWQEEGTATKQGSNYVGDVKHFSYWNCDYPYDAITVSFTLQTPDGLPLVNAYVDIRPTGADSATGGLSHGYTDSLGQVTGAVPANKNLQFVVYDECWNKAYSQNMSPITQNTDLGIIKLSNTVSSMVSIKGILVNCNSQPVTNGYAIVNLGGMIHYVSADANGQFTTTYISCTGLNTFSVTGIDQDAAQQSATATFSVGTPITDVGTITACGNAVEEQFIKYTLDGTDYSITESQGDSLYGFANNSLTNISGWSSSLKQLKFYAVGVTTTGDYNIGGLYVGSGSDSVNVDAGSKVTFTGLPSGSGNYYQGHFDNLSYWDSVPTIRHTISATFKVRQN